MTMATDGLKKIDNSSKVESTIIVYRISDEKLIGHMCILYLHFFVCTRAKIEIPRFMHMYVPTYKLIHILKFTYEIIRSLPNC